MRGRTTPHARSPGPRRAAHYVATFLRCVWRGLAGCGWCVYCGWWALGGGRGQKGKERQGCLSHCKHAA